MLIQKETNTDKVTIKAYRPGTITVMGDDYQCPLLLTATRLEKYQPVVNFAELKASHLQEIVQPDTELLLIGSGEKHAFLPMQETASLLKQGVAVECMMTRNACHTFQVLVYENRKVIALLFP